MFILAIKLDDFADDWDPYGYADAFGSRAEGVENFMTGLAKDSESILDWLNEITDECECWDDPEHDEFMEKAKELIEEVKKWTSII